ncbi:MAG: hypothetical protein ACUVQW_00710 [Candidatus Bathycorpusculaceae bacterium]
MKKLIVLKKIPVKAREYDKITGRAVSDKEVDVGNVAVAVDLDDLKAMMETAAAEKEIDLSTAQISEKVALLKSMGYEKYFQILMLEDEFKWLSET